MQLEYAIPKSQKIKLKVTEIPRKYPWLDREDDGSVTMPELDSTIVCENTKDLKILDEYGNFFIIPAGTQFYAKLKEVKEPKSFWRRGEIKLDFYKVSTASYQIQNRDVESFSAYDGKNYLQPKDDLAANSVPLDAKALNFDSKKNSNKLKNLAENLGTTGGYMVTGAILAPLAIYSISSGLGGLVSVSAMTNPYVLGGAAALGGGIGLVYGLKKEGKKFNLEPGKELEIEIANPWLLTQNFEELDIEKNTLAIEKTDAVKFHNDPNFNIRLTEVKKARDEFGDKVLKISFDYENRTNEELRLTSFKLVDSTGKEYEPSYTSDETSSKKVFGELPNRGSLDLFFSTDFPDAIHYLRVIKQYNQKPIYTTKIEGTLKKAKK